MTICNLHRLTKAWPVIAALLLVAFNQAVVAGPPVYDVEIIIFRNNAKSDAGEQWTTPASGDLSPARVFSQDEFTELSPAQYQLDAVRGGLRNSSGYTVLFHRAWRQVGYDAAHAVPYPIHSLAENGRDSIEGSVTLVRERYLHLDVDVALTTPGQFASFPPAGETPHAQPGAALFRPPALRHDRDGNAVRCTGR
jgi:hypothetical protein